MYIKLLLAICFICSAVVHDSFAWNTTSYHRVREGEYVRVRCFDWLSTPNATVHVHWTKSDDDVFNRTGAELVMPDISRNDSGNYTCCSNGDPFHSATVKTVYIDVQYPVEVTRFSVEPVYPLEGHMKTVQCWMDGNPKPSLVIVDKITDETSFGYTHDTLTVNVPSYLSGNSTFESRVAPCGHSQEITCRGYNWIEIGGAIVNQTAYRRKTVFTACPPRGAEGLVVKRLRGRGENLDLDLAMWTDVSGYPIPIYSWSRDDGQPLREPERFNGTRVRLRNLVAADFGNYTLTASNPLGNYTAKIYLIYNGKDYTGSAPPIATGFITMVLTLLCSTTESRL